MAPPHLPTRPATELRDADMFSNRQEGRRERRKGREGLRRGTQRTTNRCRENREIPGWSYCPRVFWGEGPPISVHSAPRRPPLPPCPSMHSHTSLLELQCRCAGAAAACRDLCASLEVAAVRLSALAEGMAPRLAASVDRSNEAGLKVFVALGRLGASPVAELHRLCHVAAKGLEAQGEAEAVSSRQLVACALMAEVAAASGDLAQLDAALRFLVPLVLLQNAGHDTGAWLEAYAHTRAALGEVDTMSCVADALPGVGCVSGAGAEGYVTTAPNTLSITLVGSTGEPLETVFPCDVGVRLSGGVVTGVAPWPPAPGVVCVDYTVPRGCTAPLTLRFDVMGTPLPLPLHLQVVMNVLCARVFVCLFAYVYGIACVFVCTFLCGVRAHVLCICCFMRVCALAHACGPPARR